MLGKLDGGVFWCVLVLWLYGWMAKKLNGLKVALGERQENFLAEISSAKRAKVSGYDPSTARNSKIFFIFERCGTFWNEKLYKKLVLVLLTGRTVPLRMQVFFLRAPLVERFFSSSFNIYFRRDSQSVAVRARSCHQNATRHTKCSTYRLRDLQVKNTNSNNNNFYLDLD